MPDPIVPYTPFGTVAAFPPSPAVLDRDLNANGYKIINTNWSGDPINVASEITGQLPYANIQNVTAQRILGRDSGTGVVQELIIGSNPTLTRGTLSAATTGGAGTGDFSTNTSTSVASEIVLFSNTTGKQGMRSTGSGRPKLTSGVLSLAAVDLATEITGVLPNTSHPALTGDVTCTSGTVATSIAALAVTNGKLAGGITYDKLVGTDISTVGTITTGVWNGSAIPIAYGGTGASTAATARVALNTESRKDVGDADYSFLVTDKVVALTANLNAIRTWTLPQAALINDGAVIKVIDASGGIPTLGNYYINITPFAGDTINGSTSPFILLRQRDVVELVKSSSTGWILYSNRAVVRKTFASSQTYTTPIGVKALYVECVGGGGAGGGAPVASSNLSLGAGGSGAAYAAVYLLGPAASYLITIGAGGTGVSGGTGNNGAATTFGAVCTAAAGVGGATMAAGTALAVLLGALTASVGSSLGDVISQGGTGGSGIRLSGTVGISGGGGSAGGGLGQNCAQVISTFTGQSGLSKGGGGGGALTTAAVQTGGVGGDGICLVTEYY